MKKFLLLTAILGSLFFVPKLTLATHLNGGDITWTCLNDGRYVFTFKIYKDCSGNPGAGLAGQYQLHNYPVSGSPTINLTLDASQATDIEISPTCIDPATNTPFFSCAAQDVGAVLEYTRVSQPRQLLGSPPAEGWVITYDDGNRNITQNVINSVNEGFTLRAKIFNHSGTVADSCKDNSPIFRQAPTNLLCNNIQFLYNHNATDAELDSLVYEWAEPLDNFTGRYNEAQNRPRVLPFIAPFSFDNPFPGNESLNSQTGELITNINTNVTGPSPRFISVVKVTAYKCQEKVAEIYRDLQSIIYDCSSFGNNNQPTFDAPFTDQNGNPSFDTTVTAGDLVSFQLRIFDLIAPGQSGFDSVSTTVNGIQWGTNNTSPTGCANPPCATVDQPFGTSHLFSEPTRVFNWQTDCNHVATSDQCVGLTNTYNFVFTTEDNFCPVPAVKNTTVSITVIGDSVIQSPIVNCIDVQTSGDVDLSWNTTPDPAGSFDAWMIYSSVNENGPYALIDSVKTYNTTNYTDIGANAQNERKFYYVRSRSGCKGEVLNVVRDTVSTIFVSAVNSATSVDVSWNPIGFDNSILANPTYNVFRKYPTSASFALVNTTTSTSFTDNSFTVCEDDVEYRVEVSNAPGGCNPTSNDLAFRFDFPDPQANFTFNPATPCTSTPVTFNNLTTISGGTLTYLWNFGDGSPTVTTQNPTHTFSLPGTYTVTLTATSGKNCTSDFSQSITVGFPEADAGPDVAICPGGNISIGGSPTSSTPNVTYQWSPATGLNNATIPNPQASPANTTDYTVVVTDPNGCSQSDQVRVTVNPFPTADAGPDRELCINESIQIGGSPTGPGGSSFRWSPSGSLSDEFNPNPIANPLVTTVYTVTVNSGVNCSATDQVTVTVNPLPVADAGADQTICEGTGATIGTAAIGGNTYSWTPTTALNNPAIAQPTANPIITTTYTVLVTDGNGCTNTDQVTITVDPLPTADAGADVTICEGTNTTIGGAPTGPTGASYAWTPAGSLNDATLSNPTADPTTTTTYTVVVTDVNNCGTATDQVTITVDPLPTADAGADQTICEGTNTTIGGSPTGPTGASYAWTPTGSLNDATIANPTANPITTTTYTVVVTDANNCGTTSDQVTITVDPLPTADAGADQTICEGTSTTIGGSPTGPIGATYSWTPAGSLNDATLANPTANPTTTTTYTVVVTDGSNCGTASDQVTITVDPLPTADAGVDITICDGFTAIIGGAPTGPLGASYAWSPAGSVNDATLSNPTVNPTTTTTYTVVVTDVNNCGTATDQMTVTVDPLPVADAGADQTICEGTSTTIGTTAIGGNTYSWTPIVGLNNPGIAQPTANPTTTTTYSVFVIDGNGLCTNTDDVIITVDPLPTADAGADVTICEGTSTTIGGTPTGPSGATYSWTPTTGLLDPTVSNPIADPVVTTTYTVVVTDANNCGTATDQVTVTVDPLPTADAGADVTICEGANTTIGGSPTGPTGASYAWTPAGSLNDATIANPTANPIVTTTYTVVVTDAANCGTTSDQVTITVDPLPTADAGADQTICEGTSTTIGGSPTGPAGASYAWTPAGSLNDATLANPTANPTTTTTYTVVVTDGSNCGTASDQVTITVDPLPTADAGIDQTICDGESTTIGGSPTGPAGATYSWTPTTGLLDPTVANPTANPTVTTTYTVVVTDVNNCGTASDQVLVTVNPLPVADAGADQTICEGTGTTIGTAAIGGNTYSWTPITNLDNPAIAQPTADPIVTTTYTVLVTDGNNCTNTDQVTITVDPLPTADAGADQTICEGTSTTIGGTPTGPAGATYSWTPTTGLLDPTVSNPTADPIVTTTYTVAVTDANNCGTATDQVIITVDPLPTADAGADVTICEGTNTTIGGAPTGPAGASYAWTPTGSLNDATIANPTANPITTTTYTVVVTDANNCGTVSDQVTVTVDPLPTADAGADQTICEGTNTTIGGSPTGPIGASYAWTPAGSLNDATLANPAANPTTTTTYTVVVTDGSNCGTAIDQVTITVDPLPTADAGVDQTICDGFTAVLGGAPTSGTYLWSPAGSLNDATLANPTASPTTTTTYTVVVTDVNNCGTASDQVTVTVNPLPVADAGADQTICEGTGTTIGTAGIGGSTYSWTPITALNNPAIAQPTANPIITTTYTVLVTDGNGCTNTDQVTITVDPLPTADAGADVTICEGTNTTIGGAPTGPTGASYAWTPAGSLNDATLSNPMADPTTTTTYTVVVTDVNNCGTATDQVTITVDPLPTADAGADQTICEGTSTTIGGTPTGPAGATYSWTPTTGLVDPTVSNPTANPIVTTTYTVVVTDAANCGTISDQVTITVDPLPTADAGADQTICEGTSTTIGGSPTGPAGASYAWTPAGSLNDATLANPTANPTTTTTYTVVVTDGSNCGTASDQVTITVDPLPTADAGIDQTICDGESTTIGGSPTGPAGATYSWTPTTGLLDPTVSNPTANPTVTTTYTVVVTDGNNCGTASDQVLVTVNPLPVADAGADQTICEGTGTTIGTAAIGGNTYSWTPITNLDNPAIAQPTADPIVTTIYTVLVTDANGCTNTDDVIITVDPLPTADAGADQTICEGTSTTIGGTPTGPIGATYSWTPTTGLVDPTVSNPTADPIVTTTYTVVVTDVNNCGTATDQVTITVDPLPTADAGTDQTICEGTNTTIGGAPTGPSGATYSWTPTTGLLDPTVSNPTADPIVTTTYTVVVTDAANCGTTSDQVTVTVDPLPTADAGVDQTICDLQTVQIGGNPIGNVSYSWDNASLLDDATLPNPIVTTSTTTTFTVTVTDLITGCVNTDQVTVTVNPLPVADAGADQTICQLELAQIGGTSSGAPPLSFEWDNATSLDDNTIQNPTANPIATTTYTLTVTDANGCSSTDQVEIIVNPIPTADAGLDQTICDKDTINIGSPLDPSLTYLWDNATLLEDATLASPRAFPSDTTIFTVTVTDANGCSSQDQVTINVNPLPQVDFKVDSRCEGDFAAFTDESTIAVGNIQLWEWDFGDNVGTSTLQNPAYKYSKPGTYSVKLTLTSTSNCIDSIRKDVTINQLPVADAGIDQSICFGDTVVLGGDTAGLGLAGANFSWSPGLDLSDVSAANPKAYPLSNTKYFLSVTDQNNCLNFDSIEIVVNPLPIVDAGIPADTNLCIDEQIQMNASGASSYNWLPTTYLNNPTVANPISVPKKGIEYVVFGVDDKGCISTDTVQLNVFNLDFTPGDTNVCFGDSIQLSPEIFGDETGITFSWTPSSGLSSTTVREPKASPLASQEYKLAISNTKGCADTDSLMLIVDATANVDFEFVNSARCDGAALEIENTSTTTDDFIWKLNGAVVSDELNPVIRINNNIDNTLTLIGSNNLCSDSIQKLIPPASFEEILQLKNANVFTPNGDGINDIFDPGFEGEFIGCVDFRVFDRWGEEVFNSNIGQYGWDGRTLNGINAPNGVYFYVILLGEMEIKGNVYLNR